MPNKRPRRKRAASLTGLFIQMVTWLTMFWVILLGITLTITLRSSLSSLQEEIERELSSTAAALADSEMIRSALRSGHCPDDVTEYLDDLIAANDALSVISISNMQTIRVYHVTHSEIGRSFVGGDQGRVLAGESYFSDAVGTLGPQHRYLTPVWDGETVIGFVLVSTTLDRLDVLRGQITAMYGRLALVLLVVTLVVAGAVSLWVRSLLLGFGPSELVRSYLTQSDVLNNLDEGVISVDAHGSVQLVNHAAETMLGQQAELLTDKPLDSLIQDQSGGSLLGSARKTVPTSRPNVLARTIPLRQGGQNKGTTLILTDKTEAFRMAEQLNGTRQVVSALRANTHEFMNKLQAISGLIMMDRPQEALDYIGAIATDHAKGAGPILRYIQNPNVAALLLGKLADIRALDIDLTVLGNSRLPRHSQYLSADDLITVVGNLVENAIEAIKARTDTGTRSIDLQITEDDAGLLILVSDTGCGIPPEVLPHIYEAGYTTKAQEGRGNGMALIQTIVQGHGGTIEVDSEPGEGTTFTLIFDRKREGGQPM